MAHTLYPEPRIGFRRSSQWDLNQWPHLASLYASTHHLDEDGKHPDPMMGQDNVFESPGDPIGAYKYYVQPSLRSEFSIEEPPYLNRPVYKDGESRSSGLTSGGDSFRRGATCRVVLCVFLIFCFICVVIAAVTLAVLLSKSPKKSPSAFAPIETFESSAKFHKFQFTNALKDNSSEEFAKMETEFCNAIKDMFTDHDSPVRLEFHECEVIEFINGSIIAKYRIKLRPRSPEGFKAEERINQKLEEYYAAKVKEQGPWQKIKFNPTFVRGFESLVSETTRARDIATTSTPENATSISGDINVTIAVFNITAEPDFVTDTTKTTTLATIEVSTTKAGESTITNVTILTEKETTQAKVSTTSFPPITTRTTDIIATDILTAISTTTGSESTAKIPVETSTTSVFLHISPESVHDASTIENVTKSTILDPEITDRIIPIPDQTTVISETIKHTTEQPLEKITTSTTAEITTSIDEWFWTTQQGDTVVPPTIPMVKDKATDVPEISTADIQSQSSSQSIQEIITESLGTTQAMNVTQSIEFKTESDIKLPLNITVETVTRSTEETALLQNATEVFAVASVEQFSQTTPTHPAQISTEQTSDYTTQTIVSTTAQELTMSTTKEVFVTDGFTPTSTEDAPIATSQTDINDTKVSIPDLRIIPQTSTPSPVVVTFDFEITTDAISTTDQSTKFEPPFTDAKYSSTHVPLITTQTTRIETTQDSSETKTDIITQLTEQNATTQVIESLSITNVTEGFIDTTKSVMKDIDITTATPLTGPSLSPVTSLETTQERTFTLLLGNVTSPPEAVLTDFTGSTLKESSLPVNQTSGLTSEQTTPAMLAANESSTAGASNTTLITDTVTDLGFFTDQFNTSVDFPDYFTTESVGVVSLTGKSNETFLIADTTPITSAYITTDTVEVRAEISTRSFVEEKSTIHTTGTYTSSGNITTHQLVDVATSTRVGSTTDIPKISADLSTSDMPVLNRTRKEDVEAIIDILDPSLVTDLPLLDEYSTAGSIENMTTLQTRDGTPYTDTLTTRTSAVDILTDYTDQVNKTTLSTNAIPNITDEIAVRNQTTETFTTDTPHTTTGPTNLTSDFTVAETLLHTEKVESTTENYTGTFLNQTTLSLLSTGSHMTSASTKYVYNETSTERYVNKTSPLPSLSETSQKLSEPTQAVTTVLDVTDYTTSVYTDSSLTTTDMWDIGTQSAVINETSESTTISSSTDAMNKTSETSVIQTTHSVVIQAAPLNFTAPLDSKESIVSSSEPVNQSVTTPSTSESAVPQVFTTSGTETSKSDPSVESTTAVELSNVTINGTKHTDITLTRDENDTTTTTVVVPSEIVSGMSTDATTLTYNVSKEMSIPAIAVGQDTTTSTSSSASPTMEFISDIPIMIDETTVEPYSENMTTLATQTQDLAQKSTTEKLINATISALSGTTTSFNDLLSVTNTPIKEALTEMPAMNGSMGDRGSVVFTTNITGNLSTFETTMQPKATNTSMLPQETEPTTHTNVSFVDASSGTTFVTDKHTLTTTTTIVPMQTDSTDFAFSDLTSEIPGFTDEPTTTTPIIESTTASAGQNMSQSRMVIANKSEAIIVVKEVTATVQVPSSTEITRMTNVFLEPVTVSVHTTPTSPPVIVTVQSVFTQNETSTILLNLTSVAKETTDKPVNTTVVPTVVGTTADILDPDMLLDYTTVAADSIAQSALETTVATSQNTSATTAEPFVTTGHALEVIDNRTLSEIMTTKIPAEHASKANESSSVSLTENITERTVTVTPLSQDVSNITTDGSATTTTGVIDIAADVQSTYVPLDYFTTEATLSDVGNLKSTDLVDTTTDKTVTMMESIRANATLSHSKLNLTGGATDIKNIMAPLMNNQTTTQASSTVSLPMAPSMNNQTTTQASSTVSLPEITSEMQSSTVDVSTIALETLKAAVETPDSTTNVPKSVADIITDSVKVTSQDGVNQVTTASPKAHTSTTTAPIVIAQTTKSAAIVKALRETTTEEPVYYDMTTESIFVTELPVATKEDSVTNDSVIITTEAHFTNLNNETTTQSSSTVSLPKLISEMQSSTVNVSTVALETLLAAVAMPDSTTNATESVADTTTGTVKVTSQDGVDQVTTEVPTVKANTTTEAPLVEAITTTSAPVVKTRRQTTTEEPVYYDMTTESIFVTQSPVATQEGSVTNDSVKITNEAHFTNLNNETTTLSSSTVSLPKLTSEMQSPTGNVSTVALETLNSTEAVPNLTRNAAESVTDITTDTVKLSSQDGVDQVTTAAPIVGAKTTAAAPIVKPLRQTTTEEALYYDMTTEPTFVTESPVTTKGGSIKNDSGVTDVNNIMTASLNNETTTQSPKITSETQSSTANVSTVALETLKGPEAVSVLTTNATKSVTDTTTVTVKVTSQDGVDQVTTAAHKVNANTTTAAPIVKALRQTTTEEPIYYDMTTESIFVTESPVTVHSVNNETIAQSSSMVSLPKLTSEMQNSTANVSTAALETLKSTEVVTNLTTNAPTSVTDITKGTVEVTNQDRVDQVTTTAPIVKALRPTTTEEPIYYDMTTESIFVNNNETTTQLPKVTSEMQSSTTKVSTAALETLNATKAVTYLPTNATMTDITRGTVQVTSQDGVDQVSTAAPLVKSQTTTTAAQIVIAQTTTIAPIVKALRPTTTEEPQYYDMTTEPVFVTESPIAAK